MNKESNTSKKAIITGIIAAIASSACCIPSVIALIAGVGGFSSSLSWMEPLRPYLIGFAVIAIGYAWFNHFKPKKDDSCCDIEKPKFHQKRGFLIVITLFAFLSIGYPYYSVIFYQNQEISNSDNVPTENLILTINGMTCDACENHVNYAVNELSGIYLVNTSYIDENVIIEFDPKETSIAEIKKAISSTGYELTKED